ncbi:MAG: hypothetical protein L0Y72_18570 [Gemmataceae bacterium]|nr:hypothetical protein [Gemmataceae bacterium]
MNSDNPPLTNPENPPALEKAMLGLHMAADGLQDLANMPRKGKLPMPVEGYLFMVELVRDFLDGDTWPCKACAYRDCIFPPVEVLLAVIEDYDKEQEAEGKAKADESAQVEVGEPKKVRWREFL